MFDVKKLTKADATERPEMIVNGDILPITVKCKDADGNMVDMDRQHLVYAIPVNSYIDNLGVLHQGVLDSVGVVTTKAGKAISGVGVRFKPITFDEIITLKDDKGQEKDCELRLQFEPTWRGLWSGLKVVEEGS